MKTKSTKRSPTTKITGKKIKLNVTAKPTVETEDSAILLAERFHVGQDDLITIQNQLRKGRFQRAQQQGMAIEIGQISGNQQIQQLILSPNYKNQAGLIQREVGEAEKIDENAPSAEAPGLTIGIVTQIKDLIRKHKRREALNVLVEYLGETGQINRDLLSKKKMHYSPGLSGEGQANPPGFRRDPATGTRVARPTPVRIGPSAFRKGVSWLYSSVMHEYQHVLQFQQNVARGTMGQRSLSWLIERQEVEAYATEIINSEQTGLNQHPRQMRETWRRLHAEHWLRLGRKGRKLLNDLYTKAHEIAQKVVGKRVQLPFRPAH